MFRKRKPDGFTLIELLVVIAIIAILAALVLSTAGMIQKQGAKARAKAEVEALSTALESYKTEYGDYPESSALGSAGSTILYKALVVSNATLNPLGKVFFEPTKGILSTSNYSDQNNYFVDPFGVSYNYRYIAGTNGANNSGVGFYDLWSYGGATGNKTNTNSSNWDFWIKNW